MNKNSFTIHVITEYINNFIKKRKKELSFDSIISKMTNKSIKSEYICSLLHSEFAINIQNDQIIKCNRV